MIAQPSLFDARPNPEIEQLRAEVARLKAELAALKAPKAPKPKPPFIETETHRALIEVLKDGRWHLWTELVSPIVGGSRFPARLKELRDAGRLTYEWRHSEGSRLTEYRAEVRHG